MPKFDMKLYEKAMCNVRAKIVKGELGEDELYKRAAHSYARMFDIHQEMQGVSKQIQELEAKQQNFINETMRLQGGMEVMEGMLAEALLNSGAQLEDLDMKQVAALAQEAIKGRMAGNTDQPPPAVEEKKEA